MKEVKRQYAFNGLAGCVIQHRSRLTGLLVGVYHAAQANLDESGGPWVTVCEEHSCCVNHGNLTLARSHAADPAGWCEVCGAKEDRGELPVKAA